MSRRCGGYTLIEVLVTMAVFAILTGAIFVIIRTGTMGLFEMTSKNDTQQSLRKVETDMLNEIRHASKASLGIYTPSNDYRWAIWFKTPYNDAVTDNWQITGTLSDPVVMVDGGHGDPVMQRYVLYYVALMDQATHDSTYGPTCGTLSSLPVAPNIPEVECPHKWIVKQSIYLQNQSTGLDNIGPPGGVNTVANLQKFLVDQQPQGTLIDLPSTNPNVQRVQIMADNVVSFELARLNYVASGIPAGSATITTQPTPSSTGNEVLFDIKAFKSIEASHVMHVGGAPIVVVPQTGGPNNTVNTAVSASTGVGTGQIHSASSVYGQYVPFTVQVDNRVIPFNP